MEYTEKDIISFGNYLLSKERNEHTDSESVTHADLENWKVLTLDELHVTERVAYCLKNNIAVSKEDIEWLLKNMPPRGFLHTNNLDQARRILNVRE